MQPPSEGRHRRREWATGTRQSARSLTQGLAKRPRAWLAPGGMAEDGGVGGGGSGSTGREGVWALAQPLWIHRLCRLAVREGASSPVPHTAAAPVAEGRRGAAWKLVPVTWRLRATSPQVEAGAQVNKGGRAETQTCVDTCRQTCEGGGTVPKNFRGLQQHPPPPPTSQKGFFSNSPGKAHADGGAAGGGGWGDMGKDL